jgi:hypothetical protein
MSTKAQVKTQAKTPAAPAAARVPQPTVAVPEHEAERPDIAAQLDGASRLGHSLGAIGVDGSAPPIIQRQEIPEEEEEELQLKREPAALQRQVLPGEEEEELQMKREPAAVQRQELPEEEEEELQMMPAPAGQVALQRQEPPEEEEELMLKPDEQRVGPQGGQVPSEVEAAIHRARGGGQPLEGALQEQMSANLGHDFSRVRVHTDAEADALNQQLSAKAFTTSPDIFFRQGEYNPGSDSGRELIGHELSHVVQQSTGRVNGDGRGMTVRPAGEALEQDADRVAEALTRSISTSVQEQRTQAQYEEPDLLALQRAVANPAMASPADILALQRSHGNQAVQRLLTQTRPEAEKGEEAYHRIQHRQPKSFSSGPDIFFKRRVEDSPTLTTPTERALQRHCWTMSGRQMSSFSGDYEHDPQPGLPYYRLQSTDEPTKSTFFAPANDPQVHYKKIAEDRKVDEDEVRQLIAVKKSWTRDWKYLVEYQIEEPEDAPNYTGMVAGQYDDETKTPYRGGALQTVFNLRREIISATPIKIDSKTVQDAKVKQE